MMKDAAIAAYEENWDAEAEEPRAKKTQLTGMRLSHQCSS